MEGQTYVKCSGGFKGATERRPPAEIPQILVFCCIISWSIGVLFNLELGLNSVVFSGLDYEL